MKKVIALSMAAAMLASMATSSFAAIDPTVVDSAPIFVKDDGYYGDTTNGINDVRPDKTVYVYLMETVITDAQTGAKICDISSNNLVDKDYFSFKTKKNEGSKYIKSIKTIEEKASTVGSIPGASGRVGVIEIKLQDIYDDEDHKIDLEFTFTAKSKFAKDVADDSRMTGYKMKYNVKFFTNNLVEKDNTDIEYSAGTGGYVVKPVTNDDNEIVWSDENNDIAKLKFEADSDVNKFFPKLSTKWSNDTYAAMFADQDAFIFDFVSNPTISATARPELTIYNPFMNEDDELTVDPENVVIYQIANNATLAASSEEVELATAILDGRLIDVTDKFTAGENDDGDYVFTTKTRTLGTYIVCEKAPSEEAFDEAAGETETNVPANTSKENPPTGR